jgi:phage-related baseplate assembly protein
LPDVVEVPDFAVLRAAWLARYAELRQIDVSELNDNDPAVHILEVGAYREMLAIARHNDAVRATYLSHAFGQQLDDLGADPFYDLERLVMDEGDPDAVPPVPPLMESDDAYRQRLALAPSSRSVAGPSGAYEVLAKSAFAGILDVRVTSPAPSEILIEVLHDDADTEILDAVEAAVSADDKRPLTDLVTVEFADKEAATLNITLYVPDGPDLSAVEAAALARGNQILQPIAKRVRSVEKLLEGSSIDGIAGACIVPGVRSIEVTSHVGLSGMDASAYPLTLNVTAVRSNV